MEGYATDSCIHFQSFLTICFQGWSGQGGIGSIGAAPNFKNRGCDSNQNWGFRLLVRKQCSRCLFISAITLVVLLLKAATVCKTGCQTNSCAWTFVYLTVSRLPSELPDNMISSVAVRRENACCPVVHLFHSQFVKRKICFSCIFQHLCQV